MACDTESILDQTQVGSLLGTDALLAQSGSSYVHITMTDLTNQLSSSLVDNGDQSFTHTAANGTATTFTSAPSLVDNGDGTTTATWGVTSTIVANENIYTGDGALSSNRIVDGNSNTIRWNDAKWGVNVAPTTSADIFIQASGATRALQVNGAGTASSAAYIYSSSDKTALIATMNGSADTGRAIETYHGVNFFNRFSGYNGMGTLTAGTRLSIISNEAQGITRGILVQNPGDGNQVGIQASCTGGTQKIAGKFSSTAATENIGMHVENGKVYLNTSNLANAGESRTYVGYSLSQVEDGRLNVKASVNDTYITHFSTDAANGNTVHLLTHNDNVRSVSMPNLPTSTTGLSTGDLWNDAGTLKIV